MAVTVAMVVTAGEALVVVDQVVRRFRYEYERQNNMCFRRRFTNHERIFGSLDTTPADARYARGFVLVK